MLHIEDLLAIKGADADIVRLFLTCQCNKDGKFDFVMNEFCAFLEKFIKDKLFILEKVEASILNLSPNYPSELIHGEIISFFQKQMELYKIKSIDFYKLSSIIIDWIKLHNQLKLSTNDQYWRLKFFCLLAYPVMPKIAKNIWINFGYTDDPKVRLFYQLNCYEKKARFEGGVTWNVTKII